MTARHRFANHPSPARTSVLAAIAAAGDEGTDSARVATACNLANNTAKNHIHNLHTALQIERIKDAGGCQGAVYIVTHAGRVALGLATRAEAAHTQAQAGHPHTATSRSSPPQTLYTGADLRAYTGRPGAMDAYHLPSLHNGQRQPRRVPIIMGAGPNVTLGRRL